MPSSGKIGSLKALENYNRLTARIDKACHRIQEAYAGQIACQKGCAGNCCRIHLSVFPVEAISLAFALKKQPRELVHRIRYNARHTKTFSPCPLLEKGACLMYASRLMICRTHGIPMRTEYRGTRFIGCCQKNFRNINPIPDAAVIDLDRLNSDLAKINQLFLDEYSAPVDLPPRISISKALLLDHDKF
jgi:Fe-S-cluster containining protein